MFEKTQKSTSPSILTADPVIQAKSKAGSITSTQASGEPEATFELPDVLSDLKGGVFAKELLQLLEEHRPTPKATGGCYASGECYPEPGAALIPNSYTICESILHDIFPWTVTFSNSKTTDNSLKAVLTRRNINVTEGVQIPNWKEITFFLPLNTPNVTENEICHFTVNIMGNKVDYGELPQIIFQPNIFKNALQIILRTTDELQVCPRINDPTLLDYAERKGLKLLYQVDYHKSISDKKIVKCKKHQVFLHFS